GQWDIAAQYYRKSLDRHPGNPAIWIQLGHVLKQQGDYRGAEAAYRRSLALDESAADSHLQLGHLFQLQSRWEEAGDAYARALELDPGLQHEKDALVAVYADLAAEGDKARDAREWPLASRHYRWILK